MVQAYQARSQADNTAGLIGTRPNSGAFEARPNFDIDRAREDKPVWWIWNRCEVCKAKLVVSLRMNPLAWAFVAEDKETYVRHICRACWQRHLDFAAEAEARFRRENTVEDACAQLRDGDRDVRRRAVRTLRRLGDRRAVGALRDSLERNGWDQDIFEALCDLGGPEAQRAVIAALRNYDAWDPSSSYGPGPDVGGATPVESTIGVGLMKLGGETLLLRTLLDTMTSKTLALPIRQEAAKGLVQVAWRSTLGFGVGAYSSRILTNADRNLMVGPLRAALRDHDWIIRSDATTALGYLGDTTALPELLDRLGDDHPSVRYFAAIALGDLGDPRAVPALRGALKEGAERGAVEEALAKLTTARSRWR